MEHLYEYDEFDDLLKDLSDLGLVEGNSGFLVMEQLRFSNKIILRNYVILAKTPLEAAGLFLGPGGHALVPDGAKINPAYGSLEAATKWIRQNSNKPTHRTYAPSIFEDLVLLPEKLFVESSIKVIECDTGNDLIKHMSKYFEMNSFGGFKDKKK